MSKRVQCESVGFPFRVSISVRKSFVHAIKPRFFKAKALQNDNLRSTHILPPFLLQNSAENSHIKRTEQV